MKKIRSYLSISQVHITAMFDFMLAGQVIKDTVE